MAYHIHHLQNIQKRKQDLQSAVLQRIGVTGLPLASAIDALIVAYVEAMKSEITDNVKRSMKSSTEEEGH